MNSYFTVKFQNFLSVTRSVPCSPALTVFFRMPFSTVQLLWPSLRRRCQPEVSLPLNNGLKPASSAAHANVVVRTRAARVRIDCFIVDWWMVSVSELLDCLLRWLTWFEEWRCLWPDRAPTGCRPGDVAGRPGWFPSSYCA